MSTVRIPSTTATVTAKFRCAKAAVFVIPVVFTIPFVGDLRSNNYTEASESKGKNNESLHGVRTTKEKRKEKRGGEWCVSRTNGKPLAT